MKKPINLELSNFTNILHIPHYFKQALILNERIIEDDVLKKLILGTDLKSEEITCTPHIVSQVFGEFMHSNFTNLADIFPDKNSKNNHHPTSA